MFCFNIWERYLEVIQSLSARMTGYVPFYDVGGVDGKSHLRFVFGDWFPRRLFGENK